MGEPAPKVPVIAGIDIGGTKTAVLLVDETDQIRGRGTVPTPASQGGPTMADAATALVRQLLTESGTRLVAAGVGAAGVVDSERGMIVAASETFTDWAGFPLAREMGRRLDVEVRIENDVNAFLLGELAGHDLGVDVLGIMLGTGVGGALVLDGELRRGPHGSAGEIGHIPGFGDLRCTCGQIGHLETLASGTAIGRRYGERSGNHGVGADEVARRARAGDQVAQEVFAIAGRGVALASAMTAGLLELQKVVVGGGVSASWDLLEPAINETLAVDAPVSGVPLYVEPARKGADAVALGAAASAQQLLGWRRSEVRWP